MLGYSSAKSTLELGRDRFFGALNVDLPESSSPTIRNDDLTPQFGYVGDRYGQARVLVLGTNPGNGNRNTRSPADKLMMPKLIRFRDTRSRDSFRDATLAYYEASRNWLPGSCSELFGEDKLALDQVAYSNCLPWRTKSGTRFSEDVAEQAAHIYALPLIEELKPNVVVALYKRVVSILQKYGRTVLL